MLTLAAPEKSRLGLIITAIILVVVALVAGGYVYLMATLPTPAITFKQTVLGGPVGSGDAVKIAWPSVGTSAVGAVGYGVLDSYGGEKPMPTASVAKIIAALAILKVKPLELNQPGPTITLTSADRQLYNNYAAAGGSVVPVQAGEQITQYQALQAMLIPSANNMAASMVNWAFGSESAYRDYANKMLADMGLKNTYVYDASGFSPKTISTARDLVLIGEVAMQNPVIAQIVSQTEATIPVAGKIVTTNKVMGQAGINGIKTGHTNESGGCFLFAATRDVGGKPVTIVAAIMAAPTIDDARAAAPGLIENAYTGFTNITGLKAGAVIGTVSVPWYAPVDVVAEQDVNLLVWKGASHKLIIDARPGMGSGQVGTAKMDVAETVLMQQQDIPQPDLWWRLTHPVELLNARH